MDGSRHIVESLLAWDGDAWLTAEVDGEPAGFMGCIRYDDKYAMLGFYIVRNEYRGIGAGTCYRPTLRKLLICINILLSDV